MRKKNGAQSWGISCEQLCSLTPFLVVFEKHTLWAEEEEEARWLGNSGAFPGEELSYFSYNSLQKVAEKAAHSPMSPHCRQRSAGLFMGRCGWEAQIWSQDYKHETNVNLKMSALSSRPAVCEVGHAAWLHNIYCKKWSWLSSLPQPHQIAPRIFYNSRC